jgi:hypothetical protein
MVRGGNLSVLVTVLMYELLCTYWYIFCAYLVPTTVLPVKSTVRWDTQMRTVNEMSTVQSTQMRTVNHMSTLTTLSLSREGESIFVATSSTAQV